MIYYTISIVNAKGSGRNHKRGSWSFTVDASLYTWAPIDTERLEGLADLAQDITEWLVDEFGFHGATYNTDGTGIDIPSSTKDSLGQGPYFVHVDIEDVMVAKGDYRSRSDIPIINADILDTCCRSELYSIKDMQIIPRPPSVLRMFISPSIRQAISRGVRAYLARKIFRRLPGVVR